MIRAVIFDLDGTLTDAFLGHVESYNLALKSMGLLPVKPEVFNKYYGQTGIEISRQMLKKPFVDQDVEKLTQLKHMFYAKMGGGHIRALPGAIELVNELFSRKIPIAVASSAERNAIELALRAVGIRNKVKEIASEDDIKNSKPHPEIFLKAAEKLKISPKNCLVFEDSPWGVMAAKAAGMKTVAVATGTASKKDLKKLKPDMVVGSMKEISPPMLSKILTSI